MTALSTWTRHKVRHFVQDECGAVTVDWVVLTALICTMVLALFTILTEAVFENAAANINNGIIRATTDF